MNLRIRGPRGQSTITGLSLTETTLRGLQQRLEESTGILAAEQEWLSGWPLQKLQIPSDLSAAIGCLHLSQNDLLVVQQGPAVAAATPDVVTENPHNEAVDLEDDPELAAAIAASLQESAAAPQQQPHKGGSSVSAPPATNGFISHNGRQASHTNGGPVLGSKSAAAPSGAPTSVTLPDGTAVVRRIIASDNSCLFNAVGYIMEGSLQAAPHLRQVIAETVAADPDTFTEGFLGRPNQDYCQWIQKPDKWGGAIELSILSKFFACELAAYDIQTQRQDVYGQDAGYEQQGLLLYDGLHYDAMAVAAFEGAPNELDMRTFDPTRSQAAAIHRGAAELVAQAHNARQFTDVANFTLRCGACQVGLKGEKEALEHAKATGHSNFSEYS